MIARRSFLIGLGAVLAAPAIVHAGNLMPIKRIIPPPHPLYDHPSYLVAREAAYLKNEPVSILPGHITYSNPKRELRLNRGIWVPTADALDTEQAMNLLACVQGKAA